MHHWSSHPMIQSRPWQLSFDSSAQVGLLPRPTPVRVRTLDTGGAGPVSGLLEAVRMVKDGLEFWWVGYHGWYCSICILRSRRATLLIWNLFFLLGPGKGSWQILVLESHTEIFILWWMLILVWVGFILHIFHGMSHSWIGTSRKIAIAGTLMFFFLTWSNNHRFLPRE